MLLLMILADLDGDNGYLEAKRANREVKLEASFTRGGHSHRHCSHSCDRGQKILIIVFVA